MRHSTYAEVRDEYIRTGSEAALRELERRGKRGFAWVESPTRRALLRLVRRARVSETGSKS